MKRTIAKLAATTLTAAALLGVTSVTAQIPELEPGISLPVDMEKALENERRREEHIVDPTDPAVIVRDWKYAPNNPANLPAPKDAEEAELYAQRIRDHEEHLAEVLRDRGIDMSVQEFEALCKEGGDVKSAPAPKVWLRFYRDEAMTDEYASVSDIAAGDTVYYKAESEKGYYCTQVNIKCPTIDKGSFYANRSGDQIEYSVTAGIKGDLNCDGSLDAHDINIYLKALVGAYGYMYDACTGELYRPFYDANGDGNDDAKDIIDLMKAMLGKVDLKGYSNDRYECVNYLYSYIISVRPWGSEEEYTMPLPAPLPTMELSEDKMSLVDHGIYWNNLFDDHYGFHSGSEYHGVTSEFWQGYVFAEKEVELVKGDRAPDIYVLDPNSYVGGALSGYYLSYDIPEGAETEKVIVRFAFMTHETAREKGLIAY